MNTGFTYSILQYRNSLALGESLNVGVAFAFHERNEIEFISGNLYRLKLIYPEIDLYSIKTILKLVSGRIKERSTDIFNPTILKNGLSGFLHSQVIRSDSTSLEFSKAVHVSSTRLSKEQIIVEFTKLLLPKVEIASKVTPKDREESILKKYTSTVFSANPDFEQRIEKAPRIKTDTIDVKFDYGWQNGTLNLIKALSFDLADKNHIQNKAINSLGTLTALKGYAQENNIKFDLLVDPPKKEEYFLAYRDAISILQSAEAKTEIFTNVFDYSNKTIEYLNSTLLDPLAGIVIAD